MRAQTRLLCRPATFVFALTLLLMPAIAVSAKEKAPKNRETDPLVLEKLEWFQDLKFGLFIHWGIYSQWGCIESWPLVESKEKNRPDDLKAWVERDKDMARFARDYIALNKTFNPQKFDPQTWADAAKQAGMKYIMFTTKHHDGFCMFDTKQTDYRVTHPSCPFHKNPRADIAKAVFDTFRKEGFGIGVYFSKPDWHHPDFWDPAMPHPEKHVNYDVLKQPEKWQRFVDFTHAQIEELMTGYGPADILWLDGSWVNDGKKLKIKIAKMAAMARKHQPGLLVVNRDLGGRYENYKTPEQEVPEEALPYPWETCMTMGQQWSYKPDDEYKSTRQLIHLLVDVVAKGGNFLLNIGPDADGQLPPPALQRLKEIGNWMAVNHEAIYRTRVIAPYKEGNTCLTRKGDKIYLIYLPEKDQNTPPATIKVASIRRASSVRMLGVSDPIAWKIDDGGLTIQIPEAVQAKPPCQHAWTFEVAGAVE